MRTMFLLWESWRERSFLRFLQPPALTLSCWKCRLQKCGLIGHYTRVHRAAANRDAKQEATAVRCPWRLPSVLGVCSFMLTRYCCWCCHTKLFLCVQHVLCDVSFSETWVPTSWWYVHFGTGKMRILGKALQVDLPYQLWAIHSNEISVGCNDWNTR